MSLQARLLMSAGVLMTAWEANSMYNHGATAGQITQMVLFDLALSMTGAKAFDYLLDAVTAYRAASYARRAEQLRRASAATLAANRVAGGAGERLLAGMFPSATTFQETVTTPLGRRVIDVLEGTIGRPGAIAREAKTGYQSGREVIKQIEKDASMAKSGMIDKAEWYFFKSPTSNTAGASQPVLDALKRNGIDYYILGDVIP
jgi:hypothetical protein